MRFLVTAGNTRERIDHVRDWGNIFTGKTGFDIARALTQLGEVDLLTSNPIHLAEAATIPSLFPTPFSTHAELKTLLQALVPRRDYHAIFMTAAVSDYKPAGVYSVLERERLPGEEGIERWTVRNVQAPKVKSNHSTIAILGEQTEKLVDLFRTAWSYRGLLVKFKLEVAIPVEELLKIGHNSRLASGADYLVANTLDMVNGASPGGYLIQASGHEWVPRETLAERLVALVRPKEP